MVGLKTQPVKVLLAVGLALLPLLLTGCDASSAPDPAVTVTATVTADPTAPTAGAGEAAPWDLHAVCAAEAAISTIEQWRRYQATAGRLTAGQADAITQSIAVQYLEMHEFSAASSAQKDIDALANASGTLDRPTINLESTRTRKARAGLHKTCDENGLAIGIYAQGG